MLKVNGQAATHAAQIARVITKLMSKLAHAHAVYAVVHMRCTCSAQAVCLIPRGIPGRPWCAAGRLPRAVAGAGRAYLAW